MRAGSRETVGAPAFRGKFMLDSIPASHAGEFNAPADVPQVVRHQPVFSGRAGEYFGIWFVNLLLSVLTLGIYSAWAKVRTERYFYAHTTLAGAGFDYLASPIAILKGRLIAYAFVVALVVSSKFMPVLYFLLLLALGLVMPVLMTWSLRFRARNSAWRGLSFRFDNDPGEAYGPFMLWPWLSGITLSLLYPAMKRRQHAFVVEGHRFGTKRFRFSGTTGQYLPAYLTALGCGVAAILALSMAIGAAAMVGKGNEAGKAALGGAMVAIFLGFYVAFFALLVLIRVRYINLMWNNTSLAGHKFVSTLRVRDMWWLYASNLVAIVCTLGLAVPWAMIRLARYRANHFALDARGDFDEFVAASETRAGAAGAELVDALDMGLDIGL